MIIKIIALLSVATIAAVFPIVGRKIDKKAWNNGKCPNCGAEWRMFDIDSQGGRLYECSKDCGEWIGVSYSVDKNN